jgi:predicted tellurium resistance membrane protein TerC
MFSLLTSPDAWISLATLTLLEIVLGIDNVIFLSLVANRLAPERRPVARRIGLLLALGLRVAFLSAIAWIIGLSRPVITLWNFDLSWRDIIFVAGGLFLLTKSTREIHAMSEPEGAHLSKGFSTMGPVLAQIVLLDIVFSIDSVITAVGMAEHLPIMIVAVVLAMVVMLAAAEPVAAFVARHPSAKMLALSFLILIGTALIADGMHFHIPRGYLYFAVAFSTAVEALNQWVARKKRTRTSSA